MSETSSEWSQTIQFEDRIPGDQSAWRHESILFKVDGGLGRLAVQYGTDHQGGSYQFMMLGEQPIMYSYGDDGYCPTCAHMLRVGLGQQAVDTDQIEAVKHAQQADQSIMESLEQMTSMLAMLKDGYYILTRIEMIPTDGEGNFFWNVPDSKKMYAATADHIFYRERVGDSTPKFLVPSQPMQHLDRDRVDHYIDEIRQGKRMTGLAYYYDGFISTLLDGHHRATAAYLENQTIDCLTVLRVNGYTPIHLDQPIRLYAGGETYESHLFRNPQQIVRYLEQLSRPASSKLSTDKVEMLLQMAEAVKSQQAIQPSFAREKSVYPDYVVAAFTHYDIDPSPEHIDELMKQADDDAEFELELLFKRLAMEEEPNRILPLAKRILQHPAYGSLIEDIFRYLARIDDEEIEDLFIEYILDHEPDPKDVCRQIANEYLNQR